MSNERDDLFEQEAEYEAIFRSLREKYNLDSEPKEEEPTQEFYNPEEDAELQDFFEEKSKDAKEIAEEYMYDEEDVPVLDDTPIEDLKVEDFDVSSSVETPKAEKEQTYEDLEWDENTVLDFSGAGKKNKTETPMVFEDISSNKTPEEIEDDNNISLDVIKQNQVISIEETDLRDEPVQEEADEPEIEDEIDYEPTQVIGAKEPVDVAVEEANEEPEEPEEQGNMFFIKTDKVNDLEFDEEDFDFASEEGEGDYAPAYSTDESEGIRKDVTYDNINWEDFPTQRQQKKELKEQKKAEKKIGKYGIFPKKGDSRNEIIRKVVLIVSVVAIIASSAWLVNDLVIQPLLASRLYSGILDGVLPNDNRNVSSFDDMTPEERAQAAKELLAQNSDYVGWLTVKGADVNLPVVMANSNEKYLHTGFDGKWLNAGALFVGASNQSVLDKNVVIYGHNMNNGSMFGLLRKYKESDGSIYRDYPYITFHTLSGSFKYEIFGAFLADGAGKSDNYFVNTAIKPDFSQEAFLNYMTEVRQKSYYQTTVGIKAEDKILTLVTCDRSNLSTGRLVLVAKLIEEI